MGIRGLCFGTGPLRKFFFFMIFIDVFDKPIVEIVSICRQRKTDFILQKFREDDVVRYLLDGW